MKTDANSIAWFRNTGPYINAHRGKTFVVHLGNGALESANLINLVHDFALLHSLGIRLVLVPATRSAIDAVLAEQDDGSAFHRGVRVTSADTLEVAKRVNAEQRLQLEQLLSMGLPNSPMRGARLRVGTGNFITARTCWHCRRYRLPVHRFGTACGCHRHRRCSRHWRYCSGVTLGSITYW